VGVPAPTQGHSKGGPALHPESNHTLHAKVTLGSVARNLLNSAARAFVTAAPQPPEQTFPFRVIAVFTMVQSDAEEHVFDDWELKAPAAAWISF
jgi:hypothetical protein